MVSPQGKVFACDATLMRGITEILQPSFTIEPLLTPLVEQLVKLFDNVHIHARLVIIIKKKHMLYACIMSK